MEEGLKISKEYVEFVYSYLKKIEDLEENYSIKRLSYLLKTQPKFFKDTLSFLEYKAVGMENFIIDDLRDHIVLINEIKDELPEIDFSIPLTSEDISYFYESIQKSHKIYVPFIFREHIKTALLLNEKAFLSLKARELKNDDFFKDQLMSNIQIQLVGQSEPAPCAKSSTKRAYFERFKHLPKQN